MYLMHAVTETIMLGMVEDQFYYHRQLHKLSLWHPSVPPIMTNLISWRPGFHCTSNAVYPIKHVHFFLCFVLVLFISSILCGSVQISLQSYQHREISCQPSHYWYFGGEGVHRQCNIYQIISIKSIIYNRKCWQKLYNNVLIYSLAVHIVNV